MQNVLQYNGKFYVCGTGRQTLVRSKTSNDNYYLLTMAAIAQEIRYRRGERKADVVNISPEVKHWHGAAKDSWFQHLAVEVPAEGASNEWLEFLPEEEYNKLP